MSWFRWEQPWSPADIPDLHLEGTDIWVDIGYLGGEEHRTAFAAIFARLLQDNPRFAEAAIVHIEAKRPVALSAEPQELTAANAEQLARTLYDSRNERVILTLNTSAGEARLGVEFDNPRFWLDAAAV